MYLKKILFVFSLFLIAGATAGFAAKWKAKHVVLIGIDGWGGLQCPEGRHS